MHQCSQNQNASFALLCRNPYMGFQRTHALRLGVHITFLRLLPHNGYTVPGVLLSLHECSQENLAGEPKRLICTMQDPPHGVSKGARFTAEAPSAPWLIHPLFYGGAYVISNQDPRWTRKPIYTPIFTHHIRSWIYTPVDSCFRDVSGPDYHVPPYIVIYGGGICYK